MTWLNYHHLYYFRTIAHEGSIAKASIKLSLGQPTLSTQLKQFENALGVQLFERRNRKLIITEAGRIALEYATEIFNTGEEMVEALQDRLVKSHVHIQIGALDSVPKYIISKMAQYAYGLGNCTLSILEGKGDELFRELTTHHLDLILSNYPPPVSDQQGLYAKSIAKLQVYMCGAEKYKNLKNNFPKSLNSQPIVLPTVHSKLRHDLEHFFKLNNLQLNRVAETQDTSVQKLLGVAGVGLLPLSEPAAQEIAGDGKLVKLGILPNVYEEIWLIAASRKIENPIAQKLIKSFAL
ncbi:MAG: LysR family transcriptional regulator [Oligoflexia bacterium]|nr:LysR family transcriptional regulator [Oligoflexia bacterium]